MISFERQMLSRNFRYSYLRKKYYKSKTFDVLWEYRLTQTFSCMKLNKTAYRSRQINISLWNTENCMLPVFESDIEKELNKNLTVNNSFNYPANVTDPESV